MRDILIEKHPKPKEAPEEYILTEPHENSLPYHPSIFDRINGPAIRKAAMKTQGSHGPSGVDANYWRRILSNFGQSSVNLCKTIAQLAIRIATEKLRADDLSAYNACRLIPLDKNPGVRPIGVGEVLRRIVGRSILKCITYDLKLLGQCQQLCLGQKCGIEHAIHSLREKFEKPESEAILLIDAKNAFNSLNRKLALENIKKLCPSLANALGNSYSAPSRLFVNGSIIWSQEGTTQGDPLAMAMYGIALLPLMDMIKNETVTQK